MNNRYWNPNPRGRFNRGGFNRGGRGNNRGWSWNRGDRGDYRGPNTKYEGFFGGTGNRHQKDFYPNQKQWKNKHLKKEKPLTPGKRLSEDLIGVTEYISEHEGFNGIIKSRYSDFQVAEMNEKGEIAKLTDKNPPARPTDATVDDDEDLILNKYNLEILPMETWDKINSLAVGPVSEDPEKAETVEIVMDGVSKEQRTKIHDAVKKAFGDSIVGSTINVDDKKFMRFVKYRKGVRIDNRVKWIWPGEYVYFVVHKENCDTMEAAARIAERIGVSLKPTSLGYAGTKDRRAKTSQWFSVRRVDPARLAAACRHLRDVHVGNYSFADQQLKLGMLKGNKFRIALRNITADEEHVDAACEHLKEQGFINYYGLQRFGSRIDTPTFDIGLKLLQGKYKEAIDSILEPRLEGPMVKVLRVYQSAGPNEAVKLLPARATTSEARLIRALAEAPNDLVGALNRLARNIRLLYLHSYQSLVWNRAVSERIRRFGLAPAPGDCVPLPNVEIVDNIEGESDSEEGEDDEASESTSADVSPTKEAAAAADDTSATDETPATDDTAADETVTDAASDPKTPVKKQNKKQKQQKQEPRPPLPIKILTQEDVDSGKYNVFNIVLPLPGAYVAYPPNMVDYYEELLTKDGLKMDMKHKLKSYCMAGAYRHMVVRPLCVSWRHARYSDPYADLIASDRDEIDNRLITGIIEDGKYRALLLNMILPSSCYATMALRELLKVDTSSDNQALQNNYHKRNRDNKTTSESADTTEGTNDGDKGTGENSKDGEVVLEKSKSMEVGDSENNTGEKRKLEEEEEDSAKKAKVDQ